MNFEKDLETLINRYSQENPSNTPDFILAQYLLGCLTIWNQSVQQRETWYGRDPRPGIITSQSEEGKYVANLEKELANIDAILGNRSALDGLNTRSDKIQRMIDTLRKSESRGSL